MQCVTTCSTTTGCNSRVDRIQLTLCQMAAGSDIIYKYTYIEPSSEGQSEGQNVHVNFGLVVQ